MPKGQRIKPEQIMMLLRQEEELNNLNKLKRFFSEPVANQILRPGGEDLLKPHRREIAVLFCDLRGFTTIVAESEPEEVLELLSNYHRVVEELVTIHRGVIEHFEGDGVMVFFNDPILLENFSVIALQLAQNIQLSFIPIQEKWHRLKLEIGMGIGVARGFATMGMIGYEGRSDYAAIGSVCNLASRLCNDAKDGEILFDGKCFSSIKPSSEVVNIGFVTLKGFPKAIEVYKLERGAQLVEVNE